jgi:hypothetical protein
VWSPIGAFSRSLAWTDISDCAGASRYFSFEPLWNSDQAKGAPHYDPGVGVRRSAVALGSRPQTSFIRGESRWTVQQAGLDGSDGDFDGDETGSSVDRSGVRWSKFQVATDGSFLNCVDSQILYHNASLNPYWYYCPSIMVNSVGHMLFGFSLSRENEYIGGAYIGRTSAGIYQDSLQLAQAGRGAHLNYTRKLGGLFECFARSFGQFHFFGAVKPSLRNLKLGPRGLRQ